MLDDLAELRTFQLILARGSLSAAARELGVGLAVVSKRLASLERRAGQRLINRTTRKLSPTDEGLALLPHVERILEALEAAEARLGGGRDTPLGVLRVSAPISFGRMHLAPVAAALAEAYPKLEIELRLDDRLVDLVDERIDVAVRIGQPQDSAAILRKLADNRRILVASPAYVRRRGVPRSPADLAGHDILRFGEGTEPFRMEGPDGAVADIGLRGRLRADNGDAVYDWGLAGCGVMLKSQIEVGADLRAGRLVRILPDWRSPPSPIYALTQPGRQPATKVRVFLDVLAARLKEL